MFHIVLYQPRIPPNTGNIIRLAANTGTHLHLIHPLGFAMDAAALRRAGLDYHEFADVREHDSLEAFAAAVQPAHLYGCSTRGVRAHTDVHFEPGDAVLFGPETQGLPGELIETIGPERVLRIPMMPSQRSLNLSNAVAVIVYEAWRQNAFAGATRPAPR